MWKSPKHQWAKVYNSPHWVQNNFLSSCKSIAVPNLSELIENPHSSELVAFRLCGAYVICFDGNNGRTRQTYSIVFSPRQRILRVHSFYLASSFCKQKKRNLLPTKLMSDLCIITEHNVISRNMCSFGEDLENIERPKNLEIN